MPYVIKRVPPQAGRRYVATPGRRHSYTSTLANARKFKTREEAEGNRCVKNEIVIEIV